jgi:hypothetical protein
MEKKEGLDNKYGMVIDLDKCTGLRDNAWLPVPQKTM